MEKNQNKKLYLSSICKEDIIERRENENAEKELMSYLERISQCSYCPMKFVGTPSEREKARMDHIKREHPGKRPFIIE